MSFKDYIIDRFLYILFYYISTALVIVIMSLELIIRGEQLNIGNIIYAALISTVILGISIIYDYYKKRKVYQALKEGLERKDSFDYIFNIPENASREHEAFRRLLMQFPKEVSQFYKWEMNSGKN
jgi:cell division protein FtsL